VPPGFKGMQTEFRFGIIERLTVAAFLAGVAGVVASLTLPPPIQEWLTQTGLGPYLFGASAFVIIVSVFFFFADLALYLLDKRGTTRAMALVVFGTALIVIGSIIGLVGAFRVDKEKTSSDAASRVTDLEYYFVRDFNFMSIDRIVSIRTQDLSGDLDQTTNVKIRVFRDFASNSEFIAVFVPFFSDVRMATAAESFMESLKPHIKEAREQAKLIGVKSSSPGIAVSSSEDLVFSGRVFLYTVNSLDAVEMGHLVESFRKDGMYLEIRGGSYLFYRNQQPH
jgi:hypothetical protein